MAVPGGRVAWHSAWEENAMIRRSIVAGVGIGALVALAAATSSSAALADDAPKLVPVAQSDAMIWNAVAVDGNRIFVSGPRWAGGRGPQLSLLADGGEPRPYPDAAWNAWKPGDDPASAFVNINALHLDGRGGLWIVDTGSPSFGGSPLPGGAKLVRVALGSGRVDRIVPLGPDLALDGSYIDDVRFNGDRAYLTDAGRPGLIVLDLRSGKGRRVLDGHPATVAPEGRPIVLDGETVKGPGGAPLKVHADPLEVSADGAWLFFGPLEGPWSRVPTRLLEDPAIQPDTLAAAIEPWADLPPVGGTVMGPDGTLFFAELASNSIKRRHPDGRIETLISDPALHWVDAPFLTRDGCLFLPVPQMDRVGLFHSGRSQTVWPIRLYKLEVTK
ncbi:major royal jelly family protein [Sphingomonas sp. S2-65]|uniref:major royal jelly family protein n=1 Tax=Sphingomonas sp. S2-65 TaxID=2903960 RepID=UPI001F2F2670|nr:major royal jelly family protein [Sphingomonas sp. S2-65]UYY58083.1 major royal jelly family protein [Sphingomonas sp. S2-65]